MARPSAQPRHGAEPAQRVLDWDGLQWRHSSTPFDAHVQSCLQLTTAHVTPTANAVAQLLVARYRHWVSPTDQAQELREAGIEISRSILARLLQRAAVQLEPVANALRSAALASDILAVANRSVGVGFARRLWVYVALPSMIAGEIGGAIATFRLTPDRHGGYAAQELAGFRGFIFGLHDRGYDAVLASPPVVHVGCWNELRAMVARLDPAGSHAVSLAVLRTADKLRALEEEWRDAQPARRFDKRLELARPFMDALHATLVSACHDPATPDAIRRFTCAILDRWSSYAAFLTDGRLGLSNPSASELLDRYAERGSWVFGKDRDSHVALTNMATILETCRINDIDAFSYLVTVLGSDTSSPLPLPLRNA